MHIRDIKIILAMTKAFTKRYFRDKTALFFTFLFPLVFLFVFGTIFGSGSGASFKVAIINNSDTPFSTEFVASANDDEVFKVNDVEDFASAKEQVGRGELDAIIELPTDFGALNEQQQPTGTVSLYYDEGDQQLSSTLQAVLQGVLDGINSQFVRADPPLKLQAEAIQTANLTQFDYTFSGLIGFTMLTLGIFSMTEGFTGDKKAGALRRMRVAPIKTWHLITATALNRILVGILSVALLFIVGMTVFSFNMRGDYLSFALFSVLGITLMFGFGMAIAGWAKDGNQAAPLSNLVSFPMMFLSGVFFPRFLMPEWLQSITAYIPLTPIIDGLRLILTEGKTILDLGPQLAIMGIWTVIIYLIAFKVFRWE